MFRKGGVAIVEIFVTDVVVADAVAVAAAADEGAEAKTPVGSFASTEGAELTYGLGLAVVAAVAETGARAAVGAVVAAAVW